MLYCLGPVPFDIRTDLQSVGEEVSSVYARHDVLGAAPIYEWTGEGESQIKLSGMIYPYVFGMSGLAAIEAARVGRVPLPLIRGDGRVLGWVVIQNVSRTDTMLDAIEGIGTEIEYSVTCLRTGNPGVGGAESILRLFL